MPEDMFLPVIPPDLINEAKAQQAALVEASATIQRSFSEILSAVDDPRLNPAMRRQQLYQAREKFNRGVEAYQKAWAAVIAALGECVHNTVTAADLMKKVNADFEMREALVRAQEERLKALLADEREDWTDRGLFFTNIRETWAMLTGRTHGRS